MARIHPAKLLSQALKRLLGGTGLLLLMLPLWLISANLFPIQWLTAPELRPGTQTHIDTHTHTHSNSHTKSCQCVWHSPDVGSSVPNESGADGQQPEPLAPSNDMFTIILFWHSGDTCALECTYIHAEWKHILEENELMESRGNHQPFFFLVQGECWEEKRVKIG